MNRSTKVEVSSRAGEVLIEFPDPDDPAAIIAIPFKPHEADLVARALTLCAKAARGEGILLSEIPEGVNRIDRARAGESDAASGAEHSRESRPGQDRARENDASSGNSVPRPSQDTCPHDGEWKVGGRMSCTLCGISSTDPRLKGTRFYTPPLGERAP